MSVLNIRTWGDLRAFLHVALPVIVTALIGSQLVDKSLALLVLTLLLALMSPALGVANSDDVRRTAVYAIVGAAAAILIFLGYISQIQFDTWLPVITLLLFGTSGLAAANTDTSKS